MKNIWHKEEEETHETDKFKQELNNNGNTEEIILQNEDEEPKMEFTIDYRMESL